MPLAQLADPWQKMAVESPSDSAEVSAAGRRGRRAPSPRPRRLALLPGAAPLTTFSGSHLVPGAGFCLGSLGFADLSVCSSLTHSLISPRLFFWGAAGRLPVWRRVGFGVGAEALQEAGFNQLCVGEAGGNAGAGEELRSLALPAPGLLRNLSDFWGNGFGSPWSQGLSLAKGGRGLLQRNGCTQGRVVSHEDFE